MGLIIVSPSSRHRTDWAEPGSLHLAAATDQKAQKQNALPSFRHQNLLPPKAILSPSYVIMRQIKLSRDGQQIFKQHGRETNQQINNHLLVKPAQLLHGDGARGIC
jgi:hypothetical protein